MRRFFPRNITNQGRLVRALAATALFIGGAFSTKVSIWLGLVMGVSGGLLLFQAVSGWCLLRACGIRTRL